MAVFTIEVTENVMEVGFGDEPANNDVIVREVQSMCSKLNLTGGQILKITGRCSLPAAFVIAHEVNHLFGAISVFDPKLAKFVVCISHSPDFKVGDLVD